MWILIALNMKDKTREAIFVHLTLEVSGEMRYYCLAERPVFKPAPASGSFIFLSGINLSSGQKIAVSLQLSSLFCVP